MINENKLFAIRHLPEVADFSTSPRSGVLDKSKLEFSSINKLLDELGLIEYIGEVLFVSSSTDRTMETVYTIADNHLVNFNYKTFLITTMESLIHGRYVLNYKYRAGDEPEIYREALKIYNEETFNEANLFYKHGDPMIDKNGVAKYPQLVGKFSEYGENQIQFSARFYNSLYELGKFLSDKPSSKVIIVSHVAFILRVLENMDIFSKLGSEFEISKNLCEQLPAMEWNSVNNVTNGLGIQNYMKSKLVHNFDIAFLLKNIDSFRKIANCFESMQLQDEGVSEKLQTKIYYYRHIEEKDEEQFVADRNASIDANKAYKAEEYASNLAARISIDIHLLFLSSAKNRCHQTTNLVAQKMIEKGFNLTVVFDDGLNSLRHGHYLEVDSTKNPPQIYTDSVKAYFNETFSNLNPGYSHGDPLIDKNGVAKYPQLVGKFSEYGENQIQFSVRFYTTLINLIRLYESNKNLALIVIGHCDTYLRILELNQYFSKIDTQKGVSVGFLHDLEWLQLGDVIKDTTIPKFVNESLQNPTTIDLSEIAKWRGLIEAELTVLKNL